MAEKPIECNHCQKALDVIYKEITSNSTTCTEMCNDCPILAKKLYGQSDVTPKKTSSGETPKLCCALCMTTAESIQLGDPLGCNLCYEVFEALLIQKLLDESKFPSFIQTDIKQNKQKNLHRGKSPAQFISIPLSNELTTLNSALTESIQKEHYEHAAWLRDQIKELKEKN